MRKHMNDGYSRTPRDVAEALKSAVQVADFLPDPDTLKRDIKQPVTLRLDPDVISWFRGTGSGYQTRINAVLRAYMIAKGTTARKSTRVPKVKSSKRR